MRRALKARLEIGVISSERMSVTVEAGAVPASRAMGSARNWVQRQDSEALVVFERLYAKRNTTHQGCVRMRLGLTVSMTFFLDLGFGAWMIRFSGTP